MHKIHLKDLDFLHRQHRAAKRRSSFAGKRIGIYSGTFDPVHAGHIAFALQAMKEAALDQVVFLPERQPRYKPTAQHFGHRVAMLGKAIRPHPGLAVAELTDRQFSVQRTLPELEQLFAGAQLVFLFGSDAALGLGTWPRAERLLKTCELVIAVRSEHYQEQVEKALAGWPVQPSRLQILPSFAPDVSSSQIREALRHGRYTKGLLASVRQYARREWLYISTENLPVGD